MNFTSPKFSVQFHIGLPLLLLLPARDICCDEAALPIFYGEKSLSILWKLQKIMHRFVSFFALGH